MPPPVRLSAATVQEALDRADARHWTRNPPRSPRARLAFLLRQAGGDQSALATRLDVPAHEFDVLRTVRRPSEGDPVQQAVERDIIRLWQPRIRRRAHTAILHNNGQMMVSFRAWLGLTAAADPVRPPPALPHSQSARPLRRTDLHRTTPQRLRERAATHPQRRPGCLLLPPHQTCPHCRNCDPGPRLLPRVLLLTAQAAPRTRGQAPAPKHDGRHQDGQTKRFGRSTMPSH
jgi:hypothetical protein